MAQIITAAQFKGGAAKSLTLAILAYRMSQDGAKVAVIDADEQETLVDFCKASDFEIDYVSVRMVEELSKYVNDLVKDGYDIILIDTGGYANAMVAYAMEVSDLVIVPSMTSPSDRKRARATLEYLKELSKEVERNIPAMVLMSNVKANANATIVTREFFKSLGEPKFDTEIANTTGFVDFMELGEFPGHDPVRNSVESFMYELQSKELLDYYKNKYGKVV